MTEPSDSDDAGRASAEVELYEAAIALVAYAMPDILAGVAGTEPAEAIVDAALAACDEARLSLRTRLVCTLGAESADEDMRKLLGMLRTKLILHVNERRGLVPRPETVPGSWGACVKASAAALASQPGSVEELAGEAMRQCAANEASVREDLTRRRGAAVADQMMPLFSAAVRDMAMRIIRKTRESQ